jgi:hypothetical protein
MPKSHTLKTMYEDYKESVDDPLSYSDYRECCELFNKLSMEKIIEGYKLNMGSYLSTISIIRIPMNHDNPPVNWGETNKYKQELLSGEAEEAPDEGYNESDLYSKDNPDGIKYFIYHTNNWYARFYWNKKRAKVRNKSAYRFKPTRGKKGNKTKLKEKLKNDDLHYKNYPLIDQ